MNYNFYSQQGEDLFIFLNYINQKRDDGIYVEVGALDGITYSNTKFFQDYLKFTGILIEPQKEAFQQLLSNRKNNILINKAISNKEEKVKFLGRDAAAGIVKTMNKKHIKRWYREKLEDTYFVECVILSKILEENKIIYIDFLSIDTEGGEYKVLKSIDFSKIEIYIICIELDGNNIKKDKLCREILLKNNFKLHKRININEFWINENYFRKELLFKEKNLKKIIIDKDNNSILGKHRIATHVIDILNEIT